MARAGRRRAVRTARHWWLICAALVVCLGAGTVTAYALASHGYSAHEVDLNDGGIWATSDHDGLIGRASLPAGSLDTAFYPPGGAQQDYQLDVIQDGGAVLARDRGSGKLYPIDVATGAIESDKGIALSSDEQVQLDGGTLAVLDPATGKLWAVRVDTVGGISGLGGIGGDAKPLAELGGSTATGVGAAVAVGSDGSVFAVSASGKVATIKPSHIGLSSVAYTQLDAALQAPQITAVGHQYVVFDAKTGAVLLPGHRTATIAGHGAEAQIQQPGPQARSVLIASGPDLYSIGLSNAAVSTLYSDGTGAAAAPVRLDDCAYAAWTGTPGVAVRACGSGSAAPIALAGQKSIVQPQLRVNRDAVVLNDVVNGAVWDLANGRRLDDWATVKPPTTVKPNTKSRKPNQDVGKVSAPPRAVDDTLGARPGRSTVLHVLDNDSDPGGNILSISAVTAPDNGAAKLSISPDGQTVQIAMPATAGDVDFSYTVDDGKGLSASAKVTVQSRGPGQNDPPNLRPGFQPRVWNVAAGGALSLPVLGDWRDFDGDPVLLVSASAHAGTISTTPDGRINYLAPLDAGPQTVNYTVSDGTATQSTPVTVNVLPVTSSQTTPATTQPDVARGEVGQPIVIDPLDNDLPGADPSNPDARLQLAADVASPDGTQVVTDLKAGTLTLTASHPGTFLFEYTAAYGNAPYAKGSVRVDVIAPPKAPQPPIAMLDTATLHGQQPVVVDVLANDFDPAGRLLVVQQASPASGNQLQVAIVEGRWLRINALAPTMSPNPQVVNYVITDGVSAPVTGQVSVSQLPAPADDTPVPQDDYATVRAGDSVTAPVLDNDLDPAGDQLSLTADVRGAPHAGQLSVSAAPGAMAGNAYVSGNVVRYVAPSTVPGEQTVTVDYVVQNNAGDQAVGHLHVTVEAAPTAARPDQAPTPPSVEARLVAGDTVTVPIQTTEVDPDGDSVTLVGLASAPTLGRIMSSTASTLVYQAYPTSSGTDQFSYQVIDRYGRSGTGTVRVAVVPPGQPQPPVASDVAVTAAPGAELSVDVLGQAFRSPDDDVTILPLERTNAGGVPGRATLSSPTGDIDVTADKGLTPVVVRYAITDGLGAPSYASLTVRSQAGFDIPPVAVDDYATPSAGDNIVTVDVLAKDSDPDGDAADLSVSQVFDTQATIVGGRISLPVLKTPQVVPYEIRDGHGATATAVVFVPAEGAGAPFGKADQLISMPVNGTKTIDIADYVTDPAGKPVILTTASELSAAPASGLQVASAGSRQLTLTALHGYIGPAAITFQVTDGSTLTDPGGQFGVITVPVQIGPETPVLRCPPTTLSVVEDGAPLDLDITSLCHVWVADPSQLDAIEYTASWQPQPGGVEVSGFGTKTLHVSSTGAAAAGNTGTLVVSVAGATPVPAKLNVVVTPTPPPSVSAITVDGLIAGHTATVNVASYVTTARRDPAISVVSVTPSSGMGSKISTNGSSVALTPNGDAHGTITYAVTITDVADRTRTDRHATGLITLHVLGVPDQPGIPTADRGAQSQQVTLSWAAPNNNGEPIDSYLVSWSGGQQTCAASPCTIRRLTNGEKYQFTVQAHNAVGPSKPSLPSAPVQPNAVPQAVTGFKATSPGDGTLQLTWTPAKVDGTPVLNYIVSWPGGSTTVPGTTASVRGLNNDAKTTFQIVPVNAQGPGPAATVTGQSSGTPARTAAPTLGLTQAGDHQAVVVSWSATDPNGPGPTTYTVIRTNTATGAATTICAGVTALSCPDPQVANDGSEYDYTVTAANANKNTAAPSPPAAFVARGAPGAVSGFTAKGTGQDGAATLAFTVGAPNDKAAIVHCVVASNNGTTCGDFNYAGAAGGAETEPITGLPDGPQTIQLTECNTAGTCSAPASTTVTVYGQLDPPTIDNVQTSGPNVDFSVSWNPHGAAVSILVQVTAQDGTRIYQHTLAPADTDNATHTQAFTDAADADLGTPITAGSNTRVTITATLSDASTVQRANPAPVSTPVRTGVLTAQLSKGAATCATAADPNCAAIHLQLTGFQPSTSITCTFTVNGSANGAPAAVPVTTDGNGGADGDLADTYSTAGDSLRITCEGIQSAPFTWTPN